VQTSAPAFSNAFWESYSQFVPGNTGINTLGFAILFLATRILPASKIPVLTIPFSILRFSSIAPFWQTPDSVGNTFSKVRVHAANASSPDMTVSP